MKAAALALLLVGAMAFGLVSTADAAGGKVRADDAEGPAYQLGILPFVG
jgi:hypothetical protein